MGLYEVKQSRKREVCCTHRGRAQRATTRTESRVTNSMGGIDRKLGLEHLKASGQGNSVFQWVLSLVYRGVPVLAKGSDGTQQPEVCS